MEIRSGECCIARYAGSGGVYANNSNKIDRIMLRFRPIAPKPVSGSGSGGSSPGKNEAYLRTSRVKRKYVRDQNKRCGGGGSNSRRKRRVVSEVRKDDDNQTVVTLSLLPETPDDDKKASTGTTTTTTTISSSSSSSPDLDPTVKSCPLLPVWLNSNHRMLTSVDLNVLTPQPVRPVGSCVIVEGVTDTCRGEVGEMMLGFTDVEKKMNLEKDTCPSFISDGLNRVKWTNEAYTKMVNNQDGQIQRDYESRPEMVWLVMKEKITTNEVAAAFACKVRLQYTCRKEKNTLMVPCDVWKMEGGGFAWRLDVKVALSLGR